jgi:hypothetical protein
MRLSAKGDRYPTVFEPTHGAPPGLPSTLFANGCTVSDLVGRCGAGAANHGAFVGRIAGLGNDLVKMGIVTGTQKGAIQSAAAKAP